MRLELRWTEGHVRLVHIQPVVEHGAARTDTNTHAMRIHGGGAVGRLLARCGDPDHGSIVHLLTIIP